MSEQQILSQPKAAAPQIPFYRPALAHSANGFVKEALSASLSGGGRFTALCHTLLRRAVPSTVPFLTSSCTDALELAALALNLSPGDEVVMPSWTFPSSANAFALRGVVPVFVDVDPGTLNIDPAAAEAAITGRTRALLCVHYAGVACDMASLRALCEEHAIALIEDAAQGYGAFWCEQPLGGLGDMGAFSFHGTKNVSCGEGGALAVVRSDYLARIEIAWEKGTDRVRYGRGKVDRYQWLDLGSSFLPSELTAALLSAQLAETFAITAGRRAAWHRYAALFAEAAAPGATPLGVPQYARHNGHIFGVQLREAAWRKPVLAALAAEGIDARSHYQPLHLSPAGRRLCRTAGALPATESAFTRLVRLPIDTHITAVEQEHVVGVLLDAVNKLA